MKFESAEEAASAIASACEFFGWEMAVPSSEDDNDDEIEGMVIGKASYINKVLDGEFAETPKV